MDNNKLIAEFMGLEYAPKDKRWDDWFDKDDNRITFGNRIPLQYHSSWDWLMPVIQRITDVISPFDEQDEQDFSQTLLYGYIDDVYKLVVEFIKEYNKIKPF